MVSNGCPTITDARPGEMGFSHLLRSMRVLFRCLGIWLDGIGICLVVLRIYLVIVGICLGVLSIYLGVLGISMVMYDFN